MAYVAFDLTGNSVVGARNCFFFFQPWCVRARKLWKTCTLTEALCFVNKMSARDNYQYGLSFNVPEAFKTVRSVEQI